MQPHKFSKPIKLTTAQTDTWLYFVPGLDLLLTLLEYMPSRLRVLIIYIEAILEVLLTVFSDVKAYTVSRMFWGRGGLYRNMFHIIMTGITVFGLTLGLVVRFITAESTKGLEVSYGLGASTDLLPQGAGIQTVLALDPLQPDVQLDIHKVQRGESLESIAQQYQVSVDTVRWANSDLISPFSTEIMTGWELKIPQMDGVLYTVRGNQSLEEIAQITNGNVSDIIELNELVPPNYTISDGQKLFVPNGELTRGNEQFDIPAGTFANPLSHPDCNGYRYERGFTDYHQGLDLSRYPGCPIRAIATGEVVFAGWSSLAGFNVRIDHGGGIVSHYYHGDGTFWVNVGDRVQQGQEIMMMGTTGNSTGIHLHLSLLKDGYQLNPGLYVPF